MTPFGRELQNIERFFEAIEPKLEAYSTISFNYIAVRHEDAFLLIQGRLFFTIGLPKSSFTQFQSENIRAGSYPILELQLSPRELIDRLVEGSISTPHGQLRFIPNYAESVATSYDPLHPDGQTFQSKYCVLTLLGGPVEPYIRQLIFDWELKASLTPYDSLEELAFEYLLGPLRNVMNVEAIAFNVAAIDSDSIVSGTTARLAVRLAHGLSTEKLTLGYRSFSQGRVVKRSAVNGSEMKWTQKDEYQHGDIEIGVPPAAVLHCVVSYGGITEHLYWVADPTTAQNARRVVYELFDNKLEILNDLLLTKSQARGRDARELESGVAWLLWMLGFNVAHLGGTPRTQDAADLIVTTASGHFAVIECTTGLLKADQKLSRLVERVESIRKRLYESGNRHLRVLAAIVTSKTRAEIRADIEQAERLEVFIVTREDLEQSAMRTLAPASADQFYEQAEQTVHAATAKYAAKKPEA